MPPAPPPSTESFVALVPELQRSARRLARSGDAADDLVQETLLRVWSRLQGDTPVADLRAYAFATLRNCARRPPRLPIPDGGDAADGLAGPPDAASAHLACATVLSALERLPRAQAELLRLRGVDGLSYCEIARRTGLPLGTVTSRLSRGRAALRAAMGLPEGAPASDLIRDRA